MKVKILNTSGKIMLWIVYPYKQNTKTEMIDTRLLPLSERVPRKLEILDNITECVTSTIFLDILLQPLFYFLLFRYPNLLVLLIEVLKRVYRGRTTPCGTDSGGWWGNDTIWQQQKLVWVESRMTYLSDRIKQTTNNRQRGTILYSKSPVPRNKTYDYTDFMNSIIHGFLKQFIYFIDYLIERLLLNLKNVHTNFLCLTFTQFQRQYD